MGQMSQMAEELAQMDVNSVRTTFQQYIGGRMGALRPEFRAKEEQILTFLFQQQQKAFMGLLQLYSG